MSQENNKKEVTLDELALMVQGGFTDLREEMAKGFSEVYEKMVTKEDAKQFATKQDLQELRSELNTKVNALKEDMLEVKTELAGVSKRTKEDTDAYGVDIVRIKDRISVLERHTGLAEAIA